MAPKQLFNFLLRKVNRTPNVEMKEEAARKSIDELVYEAAWKKITRIAIRSRHSLGLGDLISENISYFASSPVSRCSARSFFYAELARRNNIFF